MVETAARPVECDIQVHSSCAKTATLAAARERVRPDCMDCGLAACPAKSAFSAPPCGELRADGGPCASVDPGMRADAAYGVQSVRKWTEGILRYRLKRGLAVTRSFRQAFDAVQSNGGAISQCAVLRGTDQAALNGEQGASRPCAAHVDLDRREAMRVPGPAQLLRMKQAKIVAETDIEIGASDPVAPLVSEKSWIGEQPGWCDVADGARFFPSSSL